MTAIHIEPRPYLMRNSVQQYEWGARDGEAFIPEFLGISPEPGRPYAELWMGAHEKAPSSLDMDGRSVPLTEVIRARPLFCLGSDCLERFGGQLPFLFKVLSIAEPLSIQAHPGKEQAEHLHRRDRKHYPDENHKPEIAVALDYLAALAGLKSSPDMQRLLAKHPEISAFLGGDAGGAVEDVFTSFLRKTVSHPDEYTRAVGVMAGRLAAKGRGYSLEESLFLHARTLYGDDDAGLFALFFLQPVQLQPGEGMFLGAGVPHAYLKGTIVECMANSDNVVRVGLTPKFKDVETLVSILRDGGPADVLRPVSGAGAYDYPVPVTDFRVSRRSLAAGDRWAALYGERPEVVLLTRGRISIRGGDGQPATFSRGQSVFIPAFLERYIVQAETDAELFHVTVPEQ
ncbi:mannose-6-phosphate isomerase, class I [bacterium]|nr:mannose-6-phosphate isomerase, class I [bacterium]